MGKTIRNKPSNNSYHRTPNSLNRKKAADVTIEYTEEYSLRKHNRIHSTKSKIVDDWDDIVISTFRGQQWHYKRK